jgi:hypothetical protein
MLEQLQTWWQNLNLSAENQALALEAGVALAALLAGHILGRIASRILRARNFDFVLRLPRPAHASAPPDHGITPTMLGGMLVRLTVWTVAAWWLAKRHDRVELAATLGLIINRTWALAGVMVAALTLGSILARRLSDCLQPAVGAAAGPSRNGAAAQRWDAAGLVGAGAYLLAVLVVLLIAADMFDWPLTRASAQALWQFAQHLLIALAALFIGCLGARWARDVADFDGNVSPEKRASQYTALGIMAATTLLSVSVVLSGAGLLIGLLALAVFGFLLWMARGYVPDVVAGLQLRAHRVREAAFDGVVWQVSEIGFLTTQLCRAGEFCRVQNRQVLQARMQERPLETASR